MCFTNANKINKHVNTKTFVIATMFWEKWCRGANIFDHDYIIYIQERSGGFLSSLLVSSTNVISPDLSAHLTG